MDDNARREIDRAIQNMLQRVGQAIADDAQRFAPVDTGALRAGIHVEGPTNNTVYVVASRDVPGDDPKVPVYVEMGTRNMAAQPYLRPALYREREL